MGMPTKYNDDVARKICERLADGESLRVICMDDDMPSDRSVRTWALDPNHPFSAQYAAARIIQAYRWADEILEISDDGRNDWMEREQKGGDTALAPNLEHITRSRLRVDSRKWLLSKMLPKEFGDKQDDGPKQPVIVNVIKPDHAAE